MTGAGIDIRRHARAARPHRLEDCFAKCRPACSGAHRAGCAGCAAVATGVGPGAAFGTAVGDAPALRAPAVLVAARLCVRRLLLAVVMRSEPASVPVQLAALLSVRLLADALETARSCPARWSPATAAAGRSREWLPTDSSVTRCGRTVSVAAAATSPVDGPAVVGAVDTFVGCTVASGGADADAEPSGDDMSLALSAVFTCSGVMRFFMPYCHAAVSHGGAFALLFLAPHAAATPPPT